MAEFFLLNGALGYSINFKFVHLPRFAASCCGDDVILVVDCAAAEEGPRGVLERHQVRKLNGKELPCFIDFLYTWGPIQLEKKSAQNPAENPAENPADSTKKKGPFQ